MVKTAKEDYSTQFGKLKKLTKITTVCDIFNTVTTAKKILPEVHKLLRLFLTLPISTAIAERSFSSFKRLKINLRSTMTQLRLNNLIVLHVHKNLSDDLDLTSIAMEFISGNESRQRFFGKF